MERDRTFEQDNGLTADLAVPGQGTRLPEVVAQQDPSGRTAKLMPRSDKGLSFHDALGDSMRDHRNVYAALAK